MHTLKKYSTVYSESYCSPCCTVLLYGAPTALSMLTKMWSHAPTSCVGRILKQSGAVSYFVLHSFIHQLQVFSKRESFTGSVRTRRFNRYQRNPKERGHIQDVYDGKMY